MPRVYLTGRQRREAAEQDQRKRVTVIIRRAMGLVTAKELAQQLGVEAQVMQRRIRGAVPWDLPTLVAVADVLKLDDKSRAALMGSKTKCRFEDGYKEASV